MALFRRTEILRLRPQGTAWSVALQALQPADGGTPTIRDEREAAEELARFNRMLRVCAAAEDIAGAERILYKMIKQKVHPKTGSFAHIVAACGGQEFGDLKRGEQWGRRVASVAESGDLAVKNELIDSYMKSGDERKAQEVVKELQTQGQKPNNRTWAPLLKDLANRASKNPGTRASREAAAEAEKIWAELLASGEPGVQVYTDLLICHACAGAWDVVEQRLKDRQQVRPNVITYSALVAACAHSKDVARAARFVQQAENDGLVLTINLLNAMLKVCAKAGDKSALELWYHRLREAYQLSPDVTTMNTMLNGYACLDDTAGSDRILAEMTRRALSPDVKSYTVLIQASGRSGDTAAVERWVNKMAEAKMQLDTTAFNVALNACVQAKDLPRFLQLYSRMGELQISPDDITYRTLALPYARRGDFERVEDLMFELTKAGFRKREREYSLIISAYANARPSREPKRAERAFRDLVADGVVVNADIVKYLEMALGWERASALMEEMNIQRPPGSGGVRRRWSHMADE